MPLFKQKIWTARADMLNVCILKSRSTVACGEQCSVAGMLLHEHGGLLKARHRRLRDADAALLCEARFHQSMAGR